MQPIDVGVYAPRPRVGHQDLGRAQWVAPLAFLMASAAVLLVILYAVSTLVMRAMVFPF